MAKKQVRDTAHWVERHEHGAALTRDMLATVPGRNSARVTATAPVQPATMAPIMVTTMTLGPGVACDSA